MLVPWAALPPLLQCHTPVLCQGCATPDLLDTVFGRVEKRFFFNGAPCSIWGCYVCIFDPGAEDKAGDVLSVLIEEHEVFLSSAWLWLTKLEVFIGQSWSSSTRGSTWTCSGYHSTGASQHPSCSLPVISKPWTMMTMANTFVILVLSTVHCWRTIFSHQARMMMMPRTWAVAWSSIVAGFFQPSWFGNPWLSSRTKCL